MSGWRPQGVDRCAISLMGRLNLQTQDRRAAALAEVLSYPNRLFKLLDNDSCDQNRNIASISWEMTLT